ncbi:hypothetical protein ACLESO_41880 [Pyxidicoccus sp. 3LG]
MIRSSLAWRLALFIVAAGFSACERPSPVEEAAAPPAPAAVERRAAIVATAEHCPAEPNPGPRPTELLYVGHATAVHGASIPLEALLTDEHGRPLGGRLVQFQLGDAAASATTNEWGRRVRHAAGERRARGVPAHAPLRRRHGAGPRERADARHD